ncbi:MAG: creatininase family protein [Actinomycetota bacterium]
MKETREIAQLSAAEFQARIGPQSILVQPLGAIEQHGPHLPLSADLIIAEAIAQESVRRCVAEGLDVWLLPSLAFTKSNEHAWSPGTIWMSASTLQAILDDIARSIAATRCRKLVFFNGHGGNSSLVSMMNREIRLKHGLMTFLTHPSVPVDQGGHSHAGELGMGVHGGHDETSLMLHIRPDLVDMSLAKRAIPEELLGNDHLRFGGTVHFGWLSNDFDESGVIGDPQGADADFGSRAYEGAVSRFCEALSEIARYSIRS